MTDYTDQSLQTNLTFSDPCMTVLMASKTVHTVIKMHCLQSGQPDYFIKFCQHTVKAFTIS